jgi:hypothetical protein
MSMSKKLILFTTLLLLLCSSTMFAQKTETTTISEPATVTVQELFKRADVVALVKIVAGDSENYQAVMYKATVLKAFKGVKESEQLNFGPFIFIRHRQRIYGLPDEKRQEGRRDDIERAGRDSYEL